MSQTQDPFTTSQGSSDGDAQGNTYWRSLDQLSNPEEYRARHAEEFAPGASEPPVLSDVSRRSFMGIIAASAAMAGMTSCRKPVTKILPFGKRPEDLVPGNPTYYATAHIAGGYGTGILVKSSDGRPTKVEGNPAHPSSLGATDQLMQAELLNMYDPARSAEHYDRDHANCDDPTHEHGRIEDVAGWFAMEVGNNGAGLHLLMEPTSSPSVQSALGRFRKKYPSAKVHHWTAVHDDANRNATRKAFGKALETHYNLAKANVVVAIENDFQALDGDHIRNARDFATRRKVTSEADAAKMARLYAIESTHSVTGSNADHRFRVRATEVGDVVMALANELKKAGVNVAGDYGGYAALAAQNKYNGKDWIPALAKDLAANRGKSALVIGRRLPEHVQVVLHAINAALGNVGSDKPVHFTAMPKGLDVDCTQSITELCKAIDAGTAKMLIMLGGNPVYDAPADLEFGKKLEKLAHTAHLGQFRDETSKKCKWHINEAHTLEAWGDILGRDGTATLVQPLIAPLYGGLSVLEVIELLTVGVKDGKTPSGHVLVQNQWKSQATGSFATWWARALHDGMAPVAKAPVVTANVNASAVTAAVSGHQKAAAGSLTNLEVQFRPSYNMFDGRYANNSWLMELPDPMTKMTWDNAALVSLTTLKALDVAQGDIVAFNVGGKTVEAPVWVLPGHADHSVTMTLGFGRDLDDTFATAHGAGYNAYSVRTSATQHLATGCSAKATGAKMKLAVTQEHGSMEGRSIVRENTVSGYQKDPMFAPNADPLHEVAEVHNMAHERHVAKKKEKDPDYKPAPFTPKTRADYNKSLWSAKSAVEPTADKHDLPEGYDYTKGYQWGMVIDMNSCIGCNACVAACVSENNIATVGKEQVLMGREMHWNRIDRYFGNNVESNPKPDNPVPDFNAIPAADNPMVVHQMIPCMQCENASCEVVCPVAATVHSPEGLNDMAYNRCIGTRYCGNNCPYKVRHFNYLDYHGDVPETVKMTRNPDVTIRMRGVMEKCTYCTQRIARAKIEAKRDGRRALQDGELNAAGLPRLATACEQVCPTQAITFGDINNKESRVSKLKASNLNYGLLAEFNTRPRTTYLAKIRNPNPELV